MILLLYRVILMKMFQLEGFTWVFWRRDVLQVVLASVSNFDLASI
jgi:hypothetical protein